MELRIEKPNGGFPPLWCGVSTTSGVWFDLDNFFSIDIGKWFIRLFFQIGDFNFCRYLGVIS
jgi:hypothetical protein